MYHPAESVFFHRPPPLQAPDLTDQPLAGIPLCKTQGLHQPSPTRHQIRPRDLVQLVSSALDQYNKLKDLRQF
jgi:hypothetical protein